MSADLSPRSDGRTRVLSSTRTLARLLTTGALVSLVVAPPLPLRAEDGAAPASQVFEATDQLTLSDLERAVQAGAPAIAAARRGVTVAELESRQARILGNPTLDSSWSTIPVGETNPSNLERPLANVPSYAVGVSYTFPIRKRPARRRQAEALAQGARAELEGTVREQALELAEVLGAIATATLRREGIAELVGGGQRAIELAEARLSAQFGTPLDVDQIRIEVQRTELLLSSSESEIREGLATCSSLVGAPCQNFRDATAARAYLTRWLGPDGSEPIDLTQRADLRALRSYGDAASAARQLAEAEKLPDPTVRFGYLHDRFIISGNQRNSLSVSVSLPLPVFDRGQYRQKSAEASRLSLLDERDRRLRVAEARIPALRERLALSRGRCTRLHDEVLPQARGVLTNLEKAVASQLLSLTQVIQSRRIVSELFIEEAESCGDAYVAALELVREIFPKGDVP